jgi:predicted ribosomally synthesized peptide with SipW-like signal peptide
MMKKNIYRRIGVGMLGMVLIMGSQVTAAAFSAPEVVSNSFKIKSGQNPLETAKKAVLERTELYEKLGFTNLAIANVPAEEEYLYIYETPEDGAEEVGILLPDSICEMVEMQEDWVHIQSGHADGYIKADQLIFNDDTYKLVKEIVRPEGEVLIDNLHIYQEDSGQSKVIDTLNTKDKVFVLEYGEDYTKVVYEDVEGYIPTVGIKKGYSFPEALTMSEFKYGEGVTDIRGTVVEFAKQFLGNPYVWGGTSLTDGADCSGYVLSIYANFGIPLNRVAEDQMANGTPIEVSEAKPGDLIFYSDGESVYHVVMYIGDGQCIHASTESTGIKISDVAYEQACGAVSLLD